MHRLFILVLTFCTFKHLATAFLLSDPVRRAYQVHRKTSPAVRKIPTSRSARTATPSDDDAAAISSLSPSGDSFDNNNNNELPVTSVDAVVCGGGPAGLLTAIMLAQKYPDKQVKLYDRLSAPPSPDDESVWSDVAKFYLIGLGGRGQKSLQEFNVWDEVEKRCVAVLGRKDWAPDSDNNEGTERIFTKRDKLVTTQVLPRDKLVGVLHQYILDNYADRVELNYGYEVRPIDFDYQDGKSVLIEIAKCPENIARLNPSSVKTATEEQTEILCDTDAAAYVSTKFLIAADGTVRTFANEMERADQKRFQDMKNPLRRLFAGKPFRVKRYADDNQRIYKTVPMKIPSDWRPDLNYSARTKGGRINFDALPANKQGDYCGVLLLKKGDPLAEAFTDPAELRKLMDEVLPQFSALLDDDTIATVAKKPVSYLPGFRYAEPRLHQGNSCVILGDCAHTVKPYFGLGANSALEDVRVLSYILDSTDGDVSQTVCEFSKQRAGESKTLVRISRELDRPGKLGFITFILPLILDSIFSGLAPKLFKPNIIAMLQRENYTFQQVGRRKRLDRIAQIAIISAALTGAFCAANLLIQALARASGRTSTTVTAAVFTSAVGLVLLRQLGRFLVPGLAPADVLARLTGKVTASKTSPLSSKMASKKDDTANGETFLTPLGFQNEGEEAQ